MGTAPTWVTEIRTHAIDTSRRVYVDRDAMAWTLCGELLDSHEVRVGNVGFFATLETAVERTACEGCKVKARERMMVYAG